MTVEKLGQTSNPLPYKFILPWMSLNQENSKIYKKSEWQEKRNFLIYGDNLSPQTQVGLNMCPWLLPNRVWP